VIFGNRARARILLADDNADMRAFIRSILVRYCDVDEVPDGQVAWDRLHADPTRYDLLISDIIMPRMGGQELVRTVRSDDRFTGMRIIMLSAHAGEKNGVESLTIGADGRSRPNITCRHSY
jgi:DNA-binding response OmpR family regulator